MNRDLRYFSLLLLMTAVFCLTGAGSAWAGGIYVQAHGGFSTINLDDVNQAIDAVNEAGGAEVLDRFGTGWDAGLTLGVSLSRNLDLGLGYARLWAASEYSEPGSSVKFDMPADFFEITVDYLPDDDRDLRFGAGCDVGAVVTRASWTLSDPEAGTVDADFDGMGFLFAGYGIMDFSLGDRWSLYGQAGFRHANIGTVKVDGNVVYNPDSLDDQVRFNYSGVFLRAGVAFRP